MRITSLYYTTTTTTKKSATHLHLPLLLCNLKVLTCAVKNMLVISHTIMTIKSNYTQNYLQYVINLS